ncbi:uncharacterized protein LOC107676347 [Sinocyclocheilus anshuiensis]|uniref:uncharacterized protein LOC107676347 n=1 Tax=Sinocyclocheilus anshuiensis TaxID=1608454 RepID=UPI0007BA57A1|nr:PREDICTED: uncharacterized protein LOC107676347 [Sinocyclocheilus anshuiensis]
MIVPYEVAERYELIKHLDDIVLGEILDLFNTVWEEGNLPKEWKHAVVIPILKPGKEASDPGSYRPIALTAVLFFHGAALQDVQPNKARWKQSPSPSTVQLNQGIPRQHNSNNCGVFVLTYALYVVLEGYFDFNEYDMPTIRRCWCMLLLSNYPLKSDAERKQLRKKRRLERAEAMEAPPPVDYLTKMPLEILGQILLRVVSDDGDMAFMRLSLTCKLFRDIVSETKFKEEAHFMWLDSVVNWSAFSARYREKFRVPYSLTQGLRCCEIFKDCPPGYGGNGRRGVLRGFYSFKDFEGYCSVDCFINDGGEFQNV